MMFGLISISSLILISFAPAVVVMSQDPGETEYEDQDSREQQQQKQPPRNGGGEYGEF